jgi:hypothetical protein
MGWWAERAEAEGSVGAILRLWEVRVSVRSGGLDALLQLWTAVVRFGSEW